VVFFSCWVFVVHQIDWDNFGILNFQINKLEKNKNKHFNVVYIGDSSGGYALSTKNDSTAINLCLTGSFGFNGLISYLDIIDQHITYDTIIVMNTLDLSTREVNEQVYWLPYMYSEQPYKKAIGYINTLPFIKSVIYSKLFDRKQSVRKTKSFDFPKFGGKTKEQVNDFKGTINEFQLKQLKSLNNKLLLSKSKFCFLFGPSLPFNNIYIQELCAAFKENNIQHTCNQPYLLNEKTKGNSSDHIRPSLEDSSTLYYRNIISHLNLSQGKLDWKAFPS